MIKSKEEAQQKLIGRIIGDVEFINTGDTQRLALVLDSGAVLHISVESFCSLDIFDHENPMPDWLDDVLGFESA